MLPSRGGQHQVCALSHLSALESTFGLKKTIIKIKKNNVSDVRRHELSGDIFHGGE